MTSTHGSAAPVAIVGSGRLGTALGRLLRDRGANVVAIAGRDLVSAKRAADFIGGIEAVPIERVPALASHILISVTDDAISDVASQLMNAGLSRSSAGKCVALHTSGSRGPGELSALAESQVSTAVLHPLQTIPSPQQGVESLPGSCFAVCAGEGSGGQAVEWASEIVTLLAGRMLSIQPERWALYHAGAVFASNYIVTMVDAALEALEAAGIPRKEALAALAPISHAAVTNAFHLGPDAALTGPIARGDANTVTRNLEGLKFTTEETQAAYRAVGERTIQIARRSGLEPERLRQLEVALRFRS